MAYKGYTQEEIAQELHIDQATVSRRLKKIGKRAGGGAIDELDEAAETILREEADRMGLTYREYCKRYGLVSPALERRIKKHEATSYNDGFDNSEG